MIEEIWQGVKAVAFSTMLLQAGLVLMNIPNVVKSATGTRSKLFAMVFMMWFVVANLVILVSWANKEKRFAKQGR